MQFEAAYEDKQASECKEAAEAREGPIHAIVIFSV
jgi:hypothetical protein